MKPAWAILQSVLEDVGMALCDFYVVDTTLDDWQKLLDWLRQRNYQLRYSHPLPPHTQPLPDTAEEIFNLKSADGELLSSSIGVTIGENVLVFYFNAISEVDFDVDVSGLSTREAAEDILDFMKDIGRVLQKPVILTPEMSYQTLIFRYNPLTDELIFNPDQHESLQSFAH